MEYVKYSDLKNRKSYMDVHFASATAAFNALDALEDIMERKTPIQESVSVHDYFELCGIKDDAEEGNKRIGWYRVDLDKVTVSRSKNGYSLHLPVPKKVMPINLVVKAISIDWNNDEVTYEWVPEVERS